MARLVWSLWEQRRWDAVGAALSGLCIVHCLVMPLAIAYVPLLKFEWLEESHVHQWLAIGAMGIGGLSFLPGYLRHRRLSVLLFAGAGLSLLGYGAFLVPDACCQLECCRKEAAASVFSLDGVRSLRTPLGGLLLMLAHGLNCHLARCCSRGICNPASDTGSAD